MALSDRLPSALMDLGTLRAQDRFAQAVEWVRPYAELRTVDRQRSCNVRWRLWRLGQLVVSEAAFSPLEFHRDGRRFKHIDNEYLLLETYLAGDGEIRVGDVCATQGLGRLLLIDLSRPFDSRTGRVRTKGVLIPHADVGYDPSRHPPIVEADADSAPGRVLGHALADLTARLPRAAAAEAPALAAEIATLVRALLLEPDREMDRGVVRRARRLAIENRIEERLADPRLDIAELCHTFHLSRASLYRHFPEPGGIAGLIRARRLHAAHEELRSRPTHRGRVTAVAERWGFCDPGHFHRLFKRTYGLSPSSVTGAATTGDDAGGLTPPALLQDWLTDLSADTV